jgi:hypothetical protein
MPMPTGPPTDVSLLHVLRWVRGHGDPGNLHTTERHPIAGGTLQIPSGSLPSSATTCN